MEADDAARLWKYPLYCLTVSFAMYGWQLVVQQCVLTLTHTHVYSTITTYNLEEASTHMNEKHMLAVFLVPRDLDI